MKELSIEEKAKRYDKALEVAKRKLCFDKAGLEDSYTPNDLYEIFPELKESEDEEVRKALIDLIYKIYANTSYITCDEHERMLAWLEKQGNKDKLIADQDKLIKELGEYKVKYTQEVLENHLKIMNKDDERLRKTTIAFLKDFADKGYENAVECIGWLEKQGEQHSAIRWYDVSLIPQEMKELLVEWDSEDATWHEIAFYHADTKTFWNGTRQVENVTRWCYIVDLLEKQGNKPQGKSALEATNEEKVENADKVEPKFHERDWVILTEGELSSTLQIANVDINKELYWFNDGSYLLFADEGCLHKWTIADAKAGDVLYSPCLRLLWIFKSKDTVYCGCNLNYNDGAFCGEAFFEMPTDATPATKAQRVLLFSKMLESGYAWDEKKLELKKI